MGWHELRFVCNAENAEAISDALMGRGAISVSVEDADAGTSDEQPLFGEPGSVVDAAWKRNTVIALIDTGIDANQLLDEAWQSVSSGETPPSTLTLVAEQDWVRLTQAQFEPLRISDRLWIVPTWHESPDPAAIAIRLDPGLAFGTGSHPTTRMCLAWLDAHATGSDTVLDYGCGSGILGIAASILGAREVTATDIDPQALTSTRDNAVANNCSISIHSPDTLPAHKYSIVVANILTNPLKILAPALHGQVAPGGRLVLSGILESQADEIISAYANYLRLEIWRAEDGWVCLSGRTALGH